MYLTAPSWCRSGSSTTLAVRRPIALPTAISSLPFLQTLHNHAPVNRKESATHIQYADMVRLIEACPALLDLTLTFPNASINLLPAIARSCRRLCTLYIRSDNERVWDPSKQLLSTAAAAQQPHDHAFPSLHTLHIDYRFKTGQTAPQPSPPLLRALSSLLCRAPIRRLCLLSRMDFTHIPFYANFPFLTRLRLHNPQLRAILHEYCHPSDARTECSSDNADWRVNRSLRRMRRATGVEWDAEDDLWQEGGVRRVRVTEETWLRCPTFVSERIFVGADGRMLTGREAWLERGQLEAAAATESEWVSGHERAKVAAQKKATHQQKQKAAKSKMKI